MTFRFSVRQRVQHTLISYSWLRSLVEEHVKINNLSCRCPRTLQHKIIPRKSFWNCSGESLEFNFIVKTRKCWKCGWWKFFSSRINGLLTRAISLDQIIPKLHQFNSSENYFVLSWFRLTLEYQSWELRSVFWARNRTSKANLAGAPRSKLVSWSTFL